MGEGQGKQGGRREGKGGGILLWTEAILALSYCFILAFRGWVSCGERHFLNWVKQTVRPLMEAPSDSLGLAGEGIESSFYELRFCFSNWLDWLIHESLDCSGPGYGEAGALNQRCASACGDAEESSAVFHLVQCLEVILEKLTPVPRIDKFWGNRAVHWYVWKWIITEFTKVFSHLFFSPPLFYTW